MANVPTTVEETNCLRERLEFREVGIGDSRFGEGWDPYSILTQAKGTNATIFAGPVGLLAELLDGYSG